MQWNVCGGQGTVRSCISTSTVSVTGTELRSSSLVASAYTYKTILPALAIFSKCISTWPGVHYVDQVDLELTACLLSAGIKDMCHHAWYVLF